MAQHN